MRLECAQRTEPSGPQGVAESGTDYCRVYSSLYATYAAACARGNTNSAMTQPRSPLFGPTSNQRPTETGELEDAIDDVRA